MASPPPFAPEASGWLSGRTLLVAALLLAFLVHGPLLLMKLPLNSYDTNFHLFFASHYAESWFDPWNTKWYAGFTQTSYPPLPQMWVALFSHVMGLEMAYMTVQMIVLLLLVLGVYRYARLWVDEYAAGLAALGTVFLGTVAFLAYHAGQLSTLTAAPLYLLAIPYFYEWSRYANKRSFLKGIALVMAAAAAHNATLVFGAVLFALPVVALAYFDERAEGRSPARMISRAAIFAAVAAVAIAVVLLPFWIALASNPVTQEPIPHGSRSNYLLNPSWGLNYWIIPWGLLGLALPFLILRGAADRRLWPLLFGFWLAVLLGLGGTTHVPRLLLGRAFDVITFERFNFWATLLAMPLLGLLAWEMIARFRARAVVGLTLAAGLTCGIAVGWTVYRPAGDQALDVDEVAAFLNRPGHDQYRYLTLGFGNRLAKLGPRTNAGTVDGEWNSGRTLPELTAHGSPQLTNSKFYGTAGHESLKAMLQAAEKYGIKWVFVRDPYYEPLLMFAGWRRVDTVQRGLVGVWTRDGIPPASPVEYGLVPPRWHGLLWGMLPFGSSLLALFLIVALRERRTADVVEFPSAAEQGVYARGVKP